MHNTPQSIKNITNPKPKRTKNHHTPQSIKNVSSPKHKMSLNVTYSKVDIDGNGLRHTMKPNQHPCNYKS